jgi:hypothetical protein
MKVSVSVHVCKRFQRQATGPTQAITPKFVMGSLFHPGSAPSQGATQNVGLGPAHLPAHSPAHGLPTFGP